MARGDQLGRQWRIIQTLLTSSGKSAAELASELAIHPRTVYRDLVALQTAGFPIYTERMDGKSLWSLLDTVKHHIPVPLTFPEPMALYFGSTMLKVFKGTFFYDSLESLSLQNTEPGIGRNGEALTFKRSIFPFLSGSPIHRVSVSYTTTRTTGDPQAGKRCSSGQEDIPDARGLRCGGIRPNVGDGY